MNTGFSVSQSFATSIETSPRGILKPQVAPPRPVVRFDEVPAKGRYWLARHRPGRDRQRLIRGDDGRGGRRSECIRGRQQRGYCDHHGHVHSLMRQRVVAAALVAAVMLLAGGCGGGSPKPHVFTSMPLKPRLATIKPVYAQRLHWSGIVINSGTGYYVTANGTRVADVTSSPYTVSHLACGTTYTLGVQAHDDSGGTSRVFSALYKTPACDIVNPNFFVAQSLAGTGDGSSCANSSAVSTLSTSTEWTAGKIIGLCGTITSPITAHGSGTSRNPIIVYWEPGAIVEAPVCSGSGDGAYGCVDLHGQRNITLNGGSNGIIQSTANGTAMANHTNYADGVYAENCSGCTIENLTIKNMYVERAGSNDCSADPQGNVGIWYSGSNTTITHDTFANEADGAMLDTIAPSDTNMVISHDTFTNVGTGMNWVSNTNGGGHAGPILFDNNTLTGFNVWDTGVRDCYHQDGIHCWDGVGFTPMHYGAGMFIYDNVESGMDSTANANGYMFMEGGSGSGATVCADSTSPIYAFNNVISGIGSNGLLGVYSGEPIALNNTFLGGSSDTGVCWSANSDAVNTEFENNAVQGCGNLMANDKASIYATGQPNHNEYANSSSNAFVCTTNFVAFASFASWQSCARASLGGGSSAETKSSTQTSLALNADGSPQRGSPLIGAGANLTRLCTGNLTPLCTEINGSARPATGAWDAGAY